ncbi:MAG TPA: nitroreductase family protein [Ilumatobacteraceae bacterium]|nr:nitroreductase family protein [Ilumatobacteraceae bacterium]
MDLISALRTTGAARRFTAEPVDRATIGAILDDARFAPSGGNRQPWRVAVVEDQLLRRQLAALMRPVWDEYLAAAATGQTPFNPVAFEPPDTITAGQPNELLDQIEHIPVVLAVAADLERIALMDGQLQRPPITGGASVYPFCWSVLLAARARGFGGVMTTFLSRVEPAAVAFLGLPPGHAVAATIFLGRPEHQPTQLRRAEVATFATVDRFDGGAFST